MKMDFARHALALAVLTLSAHSASAGDLISSATASIDNLRYRLIDLDPNDGIAPALSVNGVWLGEALSSTQLAFGDSGFGSNFTQTNTFTPLSHPGVPFGSGTSTSGLPDGTATSTIGGGSLSAKVQLSTQDLLSSSHDGGETSSSYKTYQNNLYGTATYTSRSTYDATAGLRSVLLGAGPADASLSTRVSDNYPKLDLKVTPHTLLVVEGSSTLNLSADRSNLLGAIQQAGDSTYGINSYHSVDTRMASGSVQASVSVSLTDNSGFLWGTDGSEPGFAGTMSTTNLDLGLQYDKDGFRSWSGTGPLIDIALDKSASKSWTLQLANLDNADKTLYLDFNIAASANQNYENSISDWSYSFVPDAVQPPDIPNVPSIPEPGTYALMGLGLAGVALARRRRATKR